MDNPLRLEIEIEPKPPRQAELVQKELPEDIYQAAMDAKLKKEDIRLSAPVRQPSPEQLEIIKEIIDISLKVGPLVVTAVKLILNNLQKKYGHNRVRVRMIIIDGETYMISLEGDNIESALKLLEQFSSQQ